ncbi:Ig heavy chain Mem5-like [Stegostoma tigrinum]|uniref:Ig heavy chain Mem5-like n=1 Tax=Stegostoma tigrinum TaxID=3053191 RepID=UPI00202B4959|nr:Ig heavy chain Mem5-like [Stegostoma tigrinum]
MPKDSLFLMLLVQLLALHVTDSQLTVSQGPLAKTAKVGETVELECHLSYLVELVTSYFWYKQTVGEAPVAINSTSCEEPACKFVSKKGRSERLLVLEIRNVQVDDSGTYYCADRDGYAPLQNGPKLLVGESSTEKTSVLVFVPLSVPAQNGTVPLVCLVSGVSSNQIVIFWNISGEVTEGASDVGKKEPDGTWNITSQVTVTSEQWTSGALCSCVVQLGEEIRTKSVFFAQQAASREGWCSQAFPYVTAASVVVALVLMLLIIWICRRRRSGKGRRSHRENFRLTEMSQNGGKGQRHSGKNHQTEAKRANPDGAQTPGGPLYASLEFAGLEKRIKKKGARQ